MKVLCWWNFASLKRGNGWSEKCKKTMNSEKDSWHHCTTQGLCPACQGKCHCWKGFLEYDDVIHRLSVLTTVQESWLLWLIIITGEVMTQCAGHVIIGRCGIGCTAPAIVDISIKWWWGPPLMVMIVMMTTMAVNMVGTMTATMKLLKWWEWCKAMRMMMINDLPWFWWWHRC